MTTLMFERGAVGGQAGGLSMMDLSIDDIVELAGGPSAMVRPLLKTLMYASSWWT